MNFIHRVTTVGSTHIRNSSFKFLEMLLNARHVLIVLGRVNQLDITISHSLGALQRSKIPAIDLLQARHRFRTKDVLDPSTYLVSNTGGYMPIRAQSFVGALTHPEDKDRRKLCGSRQTLPPH
ncbi:hypothetical protein ACFXI6_18190 [Streptomyces mirabilis]|uniref:hypothetical protein n=1 Tax=Streptomyces mirabilis TaxID=68239 RepID=UPI0036A470D9